MTTDSYRSFCHQLNSVTNKYPYLKITELDGVQILKGILDIKNDDQEIIGSFSIEIRYCLEFPFRFPLLYEVGGDIPNDADWHKYSDSRCCITVEPDEILKCKNGIRIMSFLENYAIPFFANHIYRKTKGTYKNGAFSHGKDGLFEFYSDLFQTKEISKWKEYIDIVRSGKSIKIGRNDPCFCGSEKKFKNCHDEVFYNIERLGIRQIIKDLSILLL